MAGKSLVIRAYNEEKFIGRLLEGVLQQTPHAVYNRYRREAIAFKHIFPQEHFGLRDLLRLVVSNITTDLWQASRQGVFLPSLSSIFWFRWMQFWGTYQGYRHAGPLTWQLRQTFYYPGDLQTAQKDWRREIQPIQYNEPIEK